MDEETFSWKTGLKHMGLAIGFVVLLGLVALALLKDEVADPGKMGEGVGRFAALTGLGAVGVSWAWQTGRSKLAKALMGTWVLLVVGLAGLVTMIVMNR